MAGTHNLLIQYEDEIFKSPDQTRLIFGKSPKKTNKSPKKSEKKRKIYISPSQSSSKNSPLRVDVEKEEEAYDFHSLSLRLNIMEAENISLKEKIRNLENENLSLKTNVEEIKINMVEKTDEVAEINLKLDNIRESIPTVNVEGNIGNNAKKLSFAAVLRNGNTAVIADKIVEETKERNNKEKNYYWS